MSREDQLEDLPAGGDGDLDHCGEVAAAAVAAIAEYAAWRAACMTALRVGDGEIGVQPVNLLRVDLAVVGDVAGAPVPAKA